MAALKCCVQWARAEDVRAAMPTSSYSEDQKGGALDVIVVLHPEGPRSSEWHVVFEELKRPAQVQIQVNGRPVDSDPPLRATAEREPARFTDGLGSTSPPASLLAAVLPLLVPGRNELRYTLESGGPSVRAFLYLWRADEPTVVFDIDGTVTLNDLAGQLGALVDLSPTHAGVCELVLALHARGYHLVYLTSRTLLGVAGIERTRRFLFEVAVDTPSGARMPPAPVLTTTHVSTFAALASELGGHSQERRPFSARRRRSPGRPPLSPPHRPLPSPQAFKTRELKALRAVLGGERSALVGGFGNREKDALAYLSAGVPPEKVFIVEPNSRVRGRAALLPQAGAGGAAGSQGGAASLPRSPSWRSYLQMLRSVDVIDSLFPNLTGASTAEPTTSTSCSGGEGGAESEP